MSNRTILTARLAAALGSSKADADAILKLVSTTLQDHIAEHGQAVIPGFGRLKAVERPARRGRNPKTGEGILIPAKTVIKFKEFKGGKADEAEDAAE